VGLRRCRVRYRHEVMARNSLRSRAARNSLRSRLRESSVARCEGNSLGMAAGEELDFPFGERRDRWVGEIERVGVVDQAHFFAEIFG
jgi:hypothetical protein